MVRNWQARVEAAGTRRKEAKQRKHKSEEKRQWKQWAQEFQDLLDRNRDRLQQDQQHHNSSSNNNRRVCKLQVWTDGPPARVTSAKEQDDAVFVGGGAVIDERKKRSTSLGEGIVITEDEKGRKAKGRGRSNSSTVVDPTTKLTAIVVGKKKVHPRSKESVASGQEEATATEDQHQTRMCRSFFFTGACDQLASRGGGRNKSGGCRYVHMHGDETLCHVLLSNNNNSSSSSKQQQTNNTRNINSTGEQQLKRAEKVEMEASASETATASDPVGAMDMVYYIEAQLDLSNSSMNDDPHPLLSDQLTQVLSSKHLFLASIVYVALDGVLVFDRFQDGLIYASDRDFLIAVLGEDAVVGRRHGSAEEAAVATLIGIPGTVLEHILTFLPDQAVAAASRVCKAWHCEIAEHLPSLWKHMLDRRDWPHPPSAAIVGSPHAVASADRHEYRDQFRLHYTVIRDMKAIQKGLDAISDPRKAAVLEKEMAYQDFSSRKHAPSYPNCCVGLQEWSPNRLLVAYDHDCSLRLFETVAKSGTSGEKVCRELICQRIDPYRHTRKRRCRIVSMGLDEQCVASLCHVTGRPGDVDTAEAYVLVVLSREDFLLGESSGAADTAGGYSEDVSHLKVIDIGETVLNYLCSLDALKCRLSSDDGDHRMFQLIDFVTQDGEMEVLVSQTLVTCGYGRFMVEASISIPMEDDDGRTSLHLIDRKLLLLSATTGSIVWVGESNPQSQQLIPRREEMTLSYLRRPHLEGGSRSFCFFAVGSAISTAIIVGEIEPSGEVQNVHCLESSLMVRNEIEDEERWEILRTGHRPILVTSTDIVAADTLVRREGNVIQDRKSVISFCARYPLCTADPSCSTLSVPGNLEVVRMASIRDDHIALVCRQFNSQPPPPTGENEEDVALDAIDGHWFADNNNVAPQPMDAIAAAEVADAVKVIAIIVHASSRREIGRICLLDEQLPDALLPHLVVDGQETIGLGLSWEGVVMAGANFRSRLYDEQEEHSNKKKKKRAPNKGFKKDSFRTHNGDRCY